jgi:hypothetical protein
MHRNILLLILIASAGVAQADLIVAPSANTSANGNADTIVPLGEQDDTWTFQWQLAGSQLSAMVGDTVTGIGFRLATGESSVPAGTSIGSWNLELSSAANALGSLSSTVTSNIGPHATSVFDNSITLPALTGGTGPNPFFLILFSTPYTYTGGDLLMTLNVTNGNLLQELDGNVVDANGNTVGFDFGDASTKVGFYNYPITEFQFTSTTTLPTPEPALLPLLLGGGFALISFHRAHRRKSGRAK